jgi:hypothetical protein
VADERDLLALDRAKAAEQVAAENAFVGGGLGVALVAVRQKPIFDAVARSRRRREDPDCRYQTSAPPSARCGL